MAASRSARWQAAKNYLHCQCIHEKIVMPSREPRPSARIPAEPSQRQARQPTAEVPIPQPDVAKKPEAKDWNPWNGRAPALEAQLEELVIKPVSRAVGGPIRAIPPHVGFLHHVFFLSFLHTSHHQATLFVQPHKQERPSVRMQ